MAEIEKGFAAFARRKADELAPGLDWEKPGLEAHVALPGGGSWDVWARTRPTNFYVLTRQARELVEAEQWAEAKPVLERLVALYPDASGPQCGLRLLAATHRALGETNAERQVLTQLAERNDVATDAYARLMELAVAAQDWPAVITNASRYLAVNPLVPLPHRHLLRAGEAAGQPMLAIAAGRVLLELDPPNPAEIHFNLARLLHESGDPAARREVLLALEDAPRHRQALALLLEINRASPAGPAANATPGAEVKP
jgi:tetratricopeptide (TPR) repeat protein